MFIKRYNCLYHNLWIESMRCCRCIPVPRCQSNTYLDHFEYSSTPLLIFTFHWASREDTLNICHIFQKTRLTCPCPEKPRKPDHNDGLFRGKALVNTFLRQAVWKYGTLAPKGVYFIPERWRPKPFKMDTL